MAITPIFVKSAWEELSWRTRGIQHSLDLLIRAVPDGYAHDLLFAASVMLEEAVRDLRESRDEAPE